MVKNRENNGTDEIGSINPSPEGYGQMGNRIPLQAENVIKAKSASWDKLGQHWPM